MEKLCIKHESEIKNDFGVDISEIGVHSLRKGAASYVSSGSTCSPPQVATNIRAGWSMGIIQDTYLRYEAAGDQYVGRVVSGLPLSSPKFAVLPCQVDCSVIESEDMIKTFFPTIPGNLHCMARFFCAAILFHSDFLIKTIPSTHPFLNSVCLTKSTFPSLHKRTGVKYAWEEALHITVYRGEYDQPDDELATIIGQTSPSHTENTSSEIPPPEEPTLRMVPRVTKATGIPSHVMLLADMQKVITAQHMFLLKMKTIINEEFDKREVGHATFQVQKQVEQMLSSFESKIISKVDELGGQNKQGSQGGLSYEAMGANRNLFCWGGMYRRVPKDWEFPNKMTLRTAFHRYFLVDHKSGVGPLRFLKASDMCRQKMEEETSRT